MRIVCVICTELFVVQSHISVCNCGHVFHEDCLARWFKSGQHNCPQCRAKASDKTIVRRLYLNESSDTTLLESCSLSQADSGGSPTVSAGDPNTKVLSKERYMSMLGKIEEFKTIVTEQKDTIKTKSEAIEQRDKNLKDLNTKLTNLSKNLFENQMLINYLKRELEVLGRSKEEVEKKNKLVYELESKLREYRSIELIYKEHEDSFKNEMRKYLNEGTTNVAHLHSVIAQLVKVNVVLKDFSDKQNEEKRQIRKKLLQMERNQNEKDKFIGKKEHELKVANEQLETCLELSKQKEHELEKLQKKYETLKRMFHSQSYCSAANNSRTDDSKQLGTTSPRANHNSNKENYKAATGSSKAETIFINDTLSPAQLNSSRSPAKGAGANLSLNNNNNNNSDDDDSIPCVQLKSLQNKMRSSTGDDSDIQFIDEINRLESNYGVGKRPLVNGGERRESKDSVIFERAEFSGELDEEEQEEDVLLQISPMPKRRKNPFGVQQMAHAEDGDNAESRGATSSDAASKLSLSQRVLNSTPSYVPIVRPIVTSKRPAVDPLSGEQPQKKTLVPSANGVMYAYDGLGGRSKFLKMGEPASSRQPTTSGTSTSKVTSFSLSISSSSSKSHKMAKTTSSKDLMAPLPVSKMTLSRNKSGNLIKFKVSETNYRM